MKKAIKRAIVTATAAAVVAFPVAVLSLLVSANAKLDRLADRVELPQATVETPESEGIEILGSTSLPEVREEPTLEVESVETPTVPELDPYEVELIGRTIWGEAGGVKSKAERAAVAWCILNRVAATGKSVEEVVTAPMQFQGYRPNGECPQEHLDLATDVLMRWTVEQESGTEDGRVLPAEYLYFMGDGIRNHFTTEYLGTDYWDWSLPNPYN